MSVSRYGVCLSVLSVTRRNAGAAARAGERASLSPAGAAPAQARGNAYESGMPGHTHAHTHTHSLSLSLSLTQPSSLVCVALALSASRFSTVLLVVCSALPCCARSTY